MVITDCQQPLGYIDVAGDCDDNNIGASPDATEVCDGLDNDCDALVDEGVQSTFYRDADADTWGDSATTTTGCSAPAGFVAVSGDCNDGDRTQNPGMVEAPAPPTICW
jgi:Putative metal-binding motif